MAGTSFCRESTCIVCGKDVLPDFRRILHPPSKTNSPVREFFVRFLQSSFTFPAEETLYVCKNSCFPKLDQGMSKVRAVEQLIRDLNGPENVELSLCEKRSCILLES